MSRKFRSYIIPLLILLVIGFLTHFRTFKFALYGDDWQAIFRYQTQEMTNRNLPGLFKYFSEYGFLYFLTGFTYDIFGQNYFYYYLVSLLLKIFASFSLFLLAKEFINGSDENGGINLWPLIAAILFLVGVTGIQTTDFIVHMILYLAAALSFLSINYLSQAIKHSSRFYLLLSLLLGIISIILMPIRLFPFILIFPISAILLQMLYRPVKFKQWVGSALLLWLISISLLLYIGLFSTPGKVSFVYTSAFQKFLQQLLYHPVKLFFTSLQWLGVTIIPDRMLTSQRLQTISGFLFIFFSLITFYLARKNRQIFLKLSIALVPLLFFFTLMFAYNSTSTMGSEDRYLTMIFYGFGLFAICTIASLSQILPQFSKIVPRVGLAVFAILIAIHYIYLQKIYQTWLSEGRGADFISSTERIISLNFNQPLNTEKFVYLDFDNGKTLYFIQYGLDFKLLVLTHTRNMNYAPTVTIDKKEILAAVKRASSNEKEKIINNIYSYSLRNGTFFNSTPQLRSNLRYE